ncbi:YdbL family protein [Aliidiomarina haloalkalitolerans]|uniref:DUF1318 domain-containing protein n=1 Tax=Aliidiomarina haloalkalitolerans TaxID=859059 RepID=A0A432VXQ8_9GAMM|nr:YdbL family protein [Aliidiomarina haloalkalitolerans]RUO21493.1 DUF1318 domain-containing protein [Aliidiomarina haloalkalitolerans]
MSLNTVLRTALFSVVLLSIGFTTSAVLSQPVYAQANNMTLQQAMSALPDAKRDGLVGETETGYLGAVNEESDARIEQIVRLINSARRAEYTSIAQRNNIAVAEVEVLAGQRAIDRTPPGQYVHVNGRWLRKP